MKKRVLCLLLTLVMVLTLLPVGATAAGTKYLSSSNTDSDIISLITTIGNSIGDGNHYWNGRSDVGSNNSSKMIENAKSGNYAYGTTSKACNCASGYHLVPDNQSGWNMGYHCTSNWCDGGVQCFGFAHWMAYALFGSSLNTWTKKTSGITYDSLAPGDIIYYKYLPKNSETYVYHWVTVWKKDGNTLYVADANAGGQCRIHFGVAYDSVNTILKGLIALYHHDRVTDSYIAEFNRTAESVNAYYCLASGKTSAVIRRSPHDGGTVVGTLYSGDVIHVSKKGYNGKSSSYWYFIDSGAFAGNFIYSGNVKAVSVPPVSFTDVAVSNNHYIYSVTEYNALLVVTIKPNISGIVCTKEGIELYDSSGTISSSHLLKKFNFTDRLGFNPAIYVSFDMNAEVGYTLSPGTKYYYRFYAEIDNGSSCSIYYSDTYSCTTAQVSHTHSYGSAWKYDGTNHWHECSCGAKSSTAAHSYGSWVTTTAATHTSAGSKYRTCSVCGYKQTQSISATGHSYGTAWKSDGSNHWHECSCGAKSGTAAHSYGSWITTTAATHTSAGSKYRTCSVCGYKQTQSISATGHSYGTAWKFDDTNHWHECSCGAKSNTAVHSYGSWTIYTQATHTTDGSKYRTCSVCGYKDTQSIAATGHSYGTAWKFDDTNHWHECSCGAKINMAAHNFVNGKCSICQYSLKCGNNLTWSLDNGTLKISGSGKMTNYNAYQDYHSPWYWDRDSIKKVVVENGVTSIGAYAFEDCNNLSEVVIPDSVTSFGDYAFKDCNSLTSITIPISTTDLGMCTFWCCRNLSDIKIEGGLTGIGMYTFYLCSNLSSINIPDSVTYIDGHAFYYCKNLTSISIPASVKKISNSAFNDCKMLSDVTFLGDMPTGLNQSCFSGCSSDLTIYAPEYNTTWTSSSAYDAQAQTWNGFPIKFYHVHSYSSNTVAPTCESQGYTEYTCSCGDNYKDNYTSATGHSFSLGKCQICGAADPDYNPGGGSSGGFFSSLLNSIRSIFHNLFSWLPFC